MLDRSQTPASALTEVTPLEIDPNQPIEVVSKGTSTTNDPAGTDERPTTPTSPVGT